MRLLLAKAPESKQLRELARRIGVEDTPYPTLAPSKNNCVLFGRAAISFARR